MALLLGYAENPCCVGKAKQSSIEHCTVAAIEGKP